MARIVSFNLTGNDRTLLKDMDAGMMQEFFMEHIFFKFMDHGRSGIREGARDLVDTYMQWFVDCEKATVAELNKVPNAVYDQLLDDITRHLVSGFISSGSGGFSTPMQRAFNMIFNAIKGK